MKDTLSIWNLPCYGLSVDYELIGRLRTIKVLEYDGILTVCGKLIAGVVLDNLAILGNGYFCFIFPITSLIISSATSGINER